MLMRSMPFQGLKALHLSMLMIGLTACASPSKQLIPKEILPISFHASVGGALGNAYEIELVRDHLRYTVYTSTFFRHPRTRIIKPTRQDWTAFWREMEAVELWRWRDDYQVPPPNVVNDGTQWHINLAFGNHLVKSSGNNAYPADNDPRRGGTLVAESTARFRRFTAAVRRLTGGLDFE